MRARRKKWAAGELENNPLIIRHPENHKRRVKECFKQDRPLHLEIGCGKGRFVTEMSRRNPDVNFIALEREPAILAAAARRGLETHRHPELDPGTHRITDSSKPDGIAALNSIRCCNDECQAEVLFLLADVDDLEEFFTPGDVARLYINFCDPWPRKKKWAKRRLTHDNYLLRYERLSIPELFFKTDNRILFESSLEAFSRRSWLVTNVSLDLHADKRFEDNIMTEYEEKFSPHGPIYRLEAYPRP